MNRALPEAVALLWGGWALYWFVAAFAAKPVARRESVASRLAHLLPLAAAALLLGPRPMPGWLETRFVGAGAALDLVATALVAAGLAFAVWARIALGGNWSGTVTLKHGHTIVRSGPYRWIRHPIYTGLLVAVTGTALARGDWRGLLALAVVVPALWRKLRLEERWLEGEFGAAYSDYRATTWALLPYIV
jgi:protein-S-isoprenylcysteine O-methyltransferase Ste14